MKRILCLLLALTLLLCGCAKPREPETQPAVETTVPATRPEAPAPTEPAATTQPVPTEPAQEQPTQGYAGGELIYEDEECRIWLGGVNRDADAMDVALQLQLQNLTDSTLAVASDAIRAGDYQLHTPAGGFAVEIAPGGYASRQLSVDKNTARMLGLARLDTVELCFRLYNPASPDQAAYTPQIPVTVGSDLQDMGMRQEAYPVIRNDRLEILVAGTAVDAVNGTVRVYLSCRNRLDGDLCNLEIPGFQAGSRDYPGNLPMVSSPGDHMLDHLSAIPLPGKGQELLVIFRPQISFFYDSRTSEGEVKLTLNDQGMITRFESTVALAEGEEEGSLRENELLQPGGLHYVSGTTGEEYVVNPGLWQGDTVFAVDTGALEIRSWLPVPLREDVLGFGRATYFPFRETLSGCRSLQLQMTLRSETGGEWYVVAVCGDAVQVLGSCADANGSTGLITARFEDPQDIDGIAVVPAVQSEESDDAVISLRSDAIFAFDSAEGAKAFLELYG